MKKLNITIIVIALVLGAVRTASAEIGGWTIGAASLTGGSTTLDSSGNVTVGTGNNVARLSSNDATYRLWVGHATAGSAPFRVTSAGAVNASNLTVTGGSITGTTATFGGNVTLDSTGVKVNDGQAANDGYRFSGGGHMRGVTGAVFITGSPSVLLVVPSAGDVRWDGTKLHPLASGKTLGGSSDPWDTVFTNNSRIAGLAGSGNRAVCAAPNGDLVIC